MMALKVLREQWGIEAREVAPVPWGHSNRSWWVDAGASRYVLRYAMTARDPADESRVLDALAAARLPFATPTVVATRDGRSHHDRWRLFTRIEGETPSRGRGPFAMGDVERLFGALPAMHRALSTLPRGDEEVFGALTRWLREGPRSSLAEFFPTAFARSRDEGPRWVAEVRAISDRWDDAQWVQGDVHVKNALFAGGALSGVVDFDEAAVGSRGVDLVMGLLRVSHDPAIEARFAFDPRRFEAGRAAYGGAYDLSDLSRWTRLHALDMLRVHDVAIARESWKRTDDLCLGAYVAEVLR